MDASSYQESISNLQLVRRNPRIPIRSNYPRQLIVYDDRTGDWVATTDIGTMRSMNYLAVSYRYSDFSDNSKLEEIVRSICEIRRLTAYWLDTACIGPTLQDKCQDLYRIADVYRTAKETVIILPDMSKGSWVRWGDRVWTYPEALLSKRLLCKEGNKWVRETSLREILSLAYHENERESRLVQMYDTSGKDFSRFEERLEDLCMAIYRRSIGSPTSSLSISDVSFQLKCPPGVRVYVWMGFLQKRIMPNLRESEVAAFRRLLRRNSLECDTYPWDAIKRGSLRLGIRTFRRSAVELPKHIPEAAFYHGESTRTICEEGTRKETLAAVYNWLGIDPLPPGQAQRTGPSFFWLHGVAGSGKTTIAQTVAERCDKERVLGASFFCSRYEDCGDVINIFPTIAYQLSLINNGFKRELCRAFTADKDLQHAKPARQLLKLIVEPLKATSFPSRLVVIDGLDECKSYLEVLGALSDHVAGLWPLKLLLSSRSEQLIEEAFCRSPLAGFTQIEDLNQLQPEEKHTDLKIFLAKRLTGIASLYRLSLPWPSESDLAKLVDQANGLFMYASMVLKYIEDGSVCDPEQQLKRIIDPQQSIDHNHPSRALLDDVYLQVFQSAFPRIESGFQNKLNVILGALVLSREPLSISTLETLLKLERGTVRKTLMRLRAIVFLPETEYEHIQLIHPTIHDFLMSEGRCIDRRFVVDGKWLHAEMAQQCMEVLTKYAKEDYEAFCYMLSPSLPRRHLLQYRLENEETSVLRYSYLYWVNHLKHADISHALRSALRNFISDPDRTCLFVKDHDITQVTYIFQDLMETLLAEQRFSHPKLTTSLYQNVVLLLGTELYTTDTSSQVETAHRIYHLRKSLQKHIDFSEGLFELELEDISGSFLYLQIALAYLSHFNLALYDTEPNGNVTPLIRVARDLYDMILLPYDLRHNEKLRLLLTVLNRELLDKQKDLSDISHTTKLELVVFLLQLFDGFKELLTYVLTDSNLSELELNIYMGSKEDAVLINFLPTIIGVLYLNSKSFTVFDLEGLLDILSLPSDLVHGVLKESYFITIYDKRTVHLDYSYAMQSRWAGHVENYSPIYVNCSLEHRFMAEICLSRLLQITYDSNLEASSDFNLVEDKEESPRKADSYASTNFFFHLEAANWMLSDDFLLSLRSVGSDLIIVKFLGQIDMLQARASILKGLEKLFCSERDKPADEMTKFLYRAVVFIETLSWPSEDIGEPSIMKITGESVLRSHYPYRDGLYDLDPNLALLQVALLKVAYSVVFVDYESYFQRDGANMRSEMLKSVKIKEETQEVFGYANRAHAMILQQSLPEDESACSALKECMSSLYLDLRASRAIFNLENLRWWRESLQTFMSRFAEILDKLDLVPEIDGGFAGGLLDVSDHERSRGDSLISYRPSSHQAEEGRSNAMSKETYPRRKSWP